MRRLVSSVMVVLTMAGLMLLGAASANALSRVTCAGFNDYLRLVNKYSSSNTTCWANAGWQYVTLYNVEIISSGNNAGYVFGARYYYFNKYTTQPTQNRNDTIGLIEIY